MTSRIFSAAVIVALAAPCASLTPAYASEAQSHGMRLAKHAKLQRHQHHKTTAQRTTDGRGFYDQPYAGYRKDAAGNSYFYYRTGGDTPFGPGGGLRPPYPR